MNNEEILNIINWLFNNNTWSDRITGEQTIDEFVTMLQHTAQNEDLSK